MSSKLICNLVTTKQDIVFYGIKIVFLRSFGKVFGFVSDGEGIIRKRF